MRQWPPAFNLLTELVKKDLKTRYARPSLGFFWAFLSPLFIVIIFYIVFGLILRIETQGVPFALYLMSGIFPWVFLQNSVLQSTTSLMDNKNLIKESSFAHWLIPLSIVLANGINFLPSLGILIVVALFVFKGLPGFILLLPFVLVIYLSAAVGISLISSVLYVRWRDTKYLLEVLLQALFYSTPIVYPLYIVKSSSGPFWFNVYMHNPFVGMLNMFRLTILEGFDRSLGADVHLISLFLGPACFVAVLLGVGFYYYRRSRNSINDYLSY